MQTCERVCKTLQRPTLDEGGSLTNVASSSLRDSARICLAVALDFCIERQVLPDSDLRPQDIKLGADAQAASNSTSVLQAHCPSLNTTVLG